MSQPAFEQPSQPLENDATIIDASDRFQTEHWQDETVHTQDEILRDIEFGHLPTQAERLVKARQTVADIYDTANPGPIVLGKE